VIDANFRQMRTIEMQRATADDSAPYSRTRKSRMFSQISAGFGGSRVRPGVGRNESVNLLRRPAGRPHAFAWALPLLNHGSCSQHLGAPSSFEK